MDYRGRFAPSPTGLLHAGSLVAALASWLDARQHGGQWLIRIEDVDRHRCTAGLDMAILEQLAQCGLVSDAEVLHQSHREDAYAEALQQLIRRGWAYPCACSRRDIAAAQTDGHVRHGERIYPGSCHPSRGGIGTRPVRAWRLDVQAVSTALGIHGPLRWHDRRLGWQTQDVRSEVGDFVLKRGDGLWAYQLAVVVDDAGQGITDVVRGEDLCDNTPRQILLQRALGLPTPRYLHTPLVRGENGEKLSKQNGATPLTLDTPLLALQQAAQVLGLPAHPGPLPAALMHWRQMWATPAA